MFSKEFKLMYAALIRAKSGVLGSPESQHLGTSYPGRWQMLLSELITLLHLKDDLPSMTFYPNSSSSQSKKKGKMKSWCGEELRKGKLNPDDSRDSELGAEVALGWDSEALVEALVLVAILGDNDLTIAIGLACSELPFVSQTRRNRLVGLLLVWAGSFVTVLL